MSRHSVPETLTHDAAIERLGELGRALEPSAVASAFVASLGGRPGFWRAPLGALAAARAVPKHRYRAFSAASPACAECGLTPEVEPDEPPERGDALPGDLAMALVVLEEAHEREAPKADAQAADRLSRLLALVGELPAEAREGKLNTAVRAAKLVVGNRYDVRAVIETLGACGILETPEHLGFTSAWTSFAVRQDRPSSRVECDPPIAFWTAAHGVSSTNVAFWFGALGVDVNVPPRAASAAKASRAAAARQARATRTTELEVGDAIAVAIGGAWYAAIVVDHQADRGGRTPVIEALAWSGEEPPTVDALRGLPAAGTLPQHGARRHRVAMMDLWKRRDSRGRWQYVGSGLSAPDASHLAPPHGLFSIGRAGKDGYGFLVPFEGALKRSEGA